MIYIQAQDYSIPWADKEFIAEFGPIEGQKYYQIMYGRDSPYKNCPTLIAFETKETVFWEWHCHNGHTYMTVAEPLPYDLSLLVVFAVELKLPDLSHVEMTDRVL